MRVARMTESACQETYPGFGSRVGRVCYDRAYLGTSMIGAGRAVPARHARAGLER